MLAVCLDLSGRLAVVVGGGPVGRRKARAALVGGARVRLVCLEARPDGFGDGGFDWVTAPYEASHLDGATLAFAAGPPAVNARVAADARARGVWVNVASEPAAGDFVLPAVLRRGGLTVAVSTGGAAPALARQVRDRLSEELDHSLAEWVALLAELRPLVLEAISDEVVRREVFSELAAWPWLERLRGEGVEAVRRAMIEGVRQRAAGEGQGL